MIDEEFFTFREYMKKENKELSASMEDYLEMIYRLSIKDGYTRVSELADFLNVQPPSVSKMLQKLSELSLVDYKKYGIIMLSRKGKKIGKSLLERHKIVESFLKLIGVEECLLEETEKIEHTVSPNTLRLINRLVEFFESRPEIAQELRKYKRDGFKIY